VRQLSFGEVSCRQRLRGSKDLLRGLEVLSRGSELVERNILKHLTWRRSLVAGKQGRAIPYLKCRVV